MAEATVEPTKTSDALYQEYSQKLSYDLEGNFDRKEDLRKMLAMPQMLPLMELYTSEVFRKSLSLGSPDSVLWRFTTEHKEPNPDMSWRKYKRSGPFNWHFLRWVYETYEEWQDQARINIRINKIEAVSDTNQGVVWDPER